MKAGFAPMLQRPNQTLHLLAQSYSHSDLDYTYQMNNSEFTKSIATISSYRSSSAYPNQPQTNKQYLLHALRLHPSAILEHIFIGLSVAEALPLKDNPSLIRIRRLRLILKSVEQIEIIAAFMQPDPDNLRLQQRLNERPIVAQSMSRIEIGKPSGGRGQGKR